MFVERKGTTILLNFTGAPHSSSGTVKCHYHTSTCSWWASKELHWECRSRQRAHRGWGWCCCSWGCYTLLQSHTHNTSLEEQAYVCSCFKYRAHINGHILHATHRCCRSERKQHWRRQPQIWDLPWLQLSWVRSHSVIPSSFLCMSSCYRPGCNYTSSPAPNIHYATPVCLDIYIDS